jgi:hypothetical protein
VTALKVFASLGYRPRAPVPLDDFEVPDKRRAWVAEKGLTVFSLWSPDHPATEIDLLVEEPIPFEETYARCSHLKVSLNVEACVIGLEDLLSLKRLAAEQEIWTMLKDFSPLGKKPMKVERAPEQEGVWEKGWQGHEKAQLRRMAAPSFEEKLQWLEEAQEMVLAMERPRPTHPNPGH